MFIPIRDDAPTVRTPYVTVALMFLNGLIFLYMISQGKTGFQYLTYQYGYIPFELTHSVEVTPELPASVFFTMFSSMFMHGGFLHLIGNMLFLWIFGNNIEDYFGSVRFIFFYLISGLAAIALYTVFSPDNQIPLVGASGAIAGVMGAYMVLHARAKITVLIIFFFITFVHLPAKIVLGVWFLLQLFMSLAGSNSGGGVAWLAHVGGFAFGYVVLRLLVKWRGKGIGPDGDQRVYRVHW